MTVRGADGPVPATPQNDPAHPEASGNHGLEAEGHAGVTYFEQLLWRELKRTDSVRPDIEPSRTGLATARDAAGPVFGQAVEGAIREMPENFERVDRLDDLAAMARWSHAFRTALAGATNANDVIGPMVQNAGYKFNLNSGNYENPIADKDPTLSPWRVAGSLLRELDPNDPRCAGLRNASIQILRQAYDEIRRPHTHQERDQPEEFPTVFDDRVVQGVRDIQLSHGTATTDRDPTNRDDLRRLLETLSLGDRRRVIDEALHFYGQDYISDGTRTPQQALEHHPMRQDTWGTLEAMAGLSPDFRRALRRELYENMPPHELMDVHFDDTVQPPLLRSITRGQRIPVWQVVRRLRERAESSPDAHDRMGFGDVANLVDRAYRTAWQTSHDRLQSDRRRAGRRVIDFAQGADEP